VKVWTAFFVLALVSGVVSADPLRTESIYVEAQRAYKSGEYERAIALYEEVVAANVDHEDVFYNLGNAYFREKQMGRAIFNYERAVRLAPEFEDAQFNLQVARDAVGGEVVGETRPALWARLLFATSSGRLATFFLVLNGFAFSVLLITRFLSVGLSRTVALAAVSLAGVGALLLLLLILGRAHWDSTVNEGVVLPDTVEMREAPEADSGGVGELYAGLVLRVVADETGWLRVRISNGVEGWVPKSAVGTL